MPKAYSPKQSFLFIIVNLILVFSNHAGFVSVHAVPSYTAAEVWTQVTTNPDLLLIDDRSPSAYIESHIPTAINIVLEGEVDQALVAQIQSYGKSNIIIYCSCIGGSSARVHAEELEALLLENVYFMADDFREWPYATVSGIDPGNASISLTTGSDTNGLTNGNEPLNLQLTGLFIFNLFLASIAIVIIIYKKK